MAGKKTKRGKKTGRKPGRTTAAKKPRAAAPKKTEESRTIDLLRGWSPSRYSTR